MAGIHITDIEAAINFWRERKPSPDGVTLAPELRALAEVYALMVFHRQDSAAERGSSSGPLRVIRVTCGASIRPPGHNTADIVILPTAA